MHYLGLNYDLIICSTDKTINSFKPNPKGLNYILNRYNALPSEVVYIGDRLDVDGKCAENAKVKFVLV